MSNFLSSSIVVAAVALAGPAFASNPDGAAAANGSAVPETARVQSKAEQRYCVIEKITGSRLPLKTCKTRRDWLAEGMDPLIR